jgi:hypothetical protein
MAMSANSNQFTTTGFSYDASGNVLADGTNTYAWNAESQIKTAAGVNDTYDGDGDRVQKSNGKIYWYGRVANPSTPRHRSERLSFAGAALFGF